MSADDYPDRCKESVSPAGKENKPDVEVEVEDGGGGGPPQYNDNKSLRISTGKVISSLLGVRCPLNINMHKLVFAFVSLQRY